VPFAGEVLAALAFIMTGFGMHMTQTAGVALAADRATDETRPRVVALLYVTFLLGMAMSAVIVGWLLRDYSDLRLIQVVQGCAAATMVINVIALWRQEKARPMTRAEREAPRPKFAEAWADFTAGGQVGRLLVVVALGGLAFNMQDVLLEPYGGEVLGLSVSATTLLTAFNAIGALTGFLLSARTLGQGADPYRLAAKGILIGIAAFSAVICAAPMGLPWLFYAGAYGIGLGMGLFAVATLTAAMTLPMRGVAGGGLALGAWGAAQATAAGLAAALGGGLRDTFGGLAQAGHLGALTSSDVGYMVVYHLEIGLLFLTLALVGPLVRMTVLKPATEPRQGPIGLAEFPT